MSERKERVVKVLIILAILLVFTGTGFVSFERLYSGVTIAMLILIYLDGGGE